MQSVREKFQSWFTLFSDDESKQIGIYGPPNSGKSTLANRIVQDWTGESLSTEGPVPHETRTAQKKDNVVIEHEGNEVELDIVDTPGISTEVDANEFEEFDMDSEMADQRAKEATNGIAEAMHWLREDVDGVIYMMDSTEDPFMQVNTMIIGIIESQDLPVLVLANKIDKEDSDEKRVKEAFPQHTTVPISAKEGDNVEDLYKQLAVKFG